MLKVSLYQKYKITPNVYAANKKVSKHTNNDKTKRNNR